ncbi:MAG TPA: site-2 protease family protein [Micromonosporaceae bacterium]|nr:site-2 protease family protein [Micromonosporaceae bacterium]
MTEPPAPPPTAGPSAGPTRPGLVRVGRVAGVPVYLTFSWLILAVLITIGYGSYVGGDRPLAVTYLLGFGIVVCLVVSVLLHELGHAFVARRYGVGVRGITLELLGGFTEMDREAPSPRSEAAIALAGPGVSLVLALLGGLAIPITDRGTVLGDIAIQFALSNAIVAVFNGLPGLPLDGGRALRAGVWAATRNPYKADVAAGWAGRVIALATLGVTVVLFLGGGVLPYVSVLLLALVALTIWSGASAAITTARVRAKLPELSAGRLARPLFLVPTGTPLAEALRRRDESHRDDGTLHRLVLGIADGIGRVVGVVDSREVATVPVERRPWVSVDSVSQRVTPTQRVAAESSGEAVLAAIQAHPGEDLLVTVGEDVVGVLRVTDFISELSSRRGG